MKKKFIKVGRRRVGGRIVKQKFIKVGGRWAGGRIVKKKFIKVGGRWAGGRIVKKKSLSINSGSGQTTCEDRGGSVTEPRGLIRQ